MPSIRLHIIMCLIGIAFFAFAAEPQSSANLPLFDKNDYQAYLQAIITDLQAAKVSPPLTFDTLTALTVSLEKTNGWKSDSAQKLQTLLKNAPENLRMMVDLRKIINGDYTGLEDLYRAKPFDPEYSEVMKSITLLRAHGYPVAADALNTLCPDEFGKRIAAWQRLPAEARKTVDALMRTRYPPNTPNTKMFLQTALELYKHPPKDAGVNPEAYLDFMLWFGKGSLEVSFASAQEILAVGKRDGAFKMARAMVTDNDMAYGAHRLLANFFFRANDLPATTEAYQAGMKAIREPFTREIRLDYLEYLATLARLKPKDYTPSTLAAAQQDADPLLAGDAFLVGGKYPEAAAKFLPLLQDAAAPFGRRLSALNGLLDSDPAAALPQLNGLLDAIEKHAPAARAEELRWLGWQLARITEREVPPAPNSFRMATRMQYRPVREVPDWAATLASTVDRMLAIDSATLLQPDQYAPQDTFRYGAGLIYALAGQPDKAKTVITQPLTYTLPPPPGGWPTFGGPKEPDTDKPRTFTSPARGEAERVMTAVMEGLARYQARAAKADPPAAPPATTPLNTQLITDLAAKIVALEDPVEIKSQMRRLGEQIDLAVSCLDPMPPVKDRNQPPPPVRTIDMTQFAPIAKAIRDVFADNEAIREAPMVISLGLKRGMLTASNPQLLEELYTLTVTGVERYITVTGNTTVGISLAHTFASALEVRLVVDVKSYAKRLREKFPKPTR